MIIIYKREEENELELTKLDLARVFLGRLKDIVNLDNSWERKYDLVFDKNMSRIIYREFKDFEYCDPDTTYKEDVIAFVSQFEWYVEELAKK